MNGTKAGGMRRFTPSSPAIALAVGVLGSGAANVAWTWELGWVRVAAGLFATLLVPTSLHLWPRVPVNGWITRVIRAVVMTYICAAAAIVNLAHSARLLTTDPAVVHPPAEDLLLAVLLITAVEGVMVMATLAKRAKPEPQAAAGVASEHNLALLIAVARTLAAKPEQPRRRPRPTPAPAVEPVIKPDDLAPRRIERDQSRRDLGKAYARKAWPVTGQQIADEVGVSKSEGDRIRAAVKAELEPAS